MAKNSKRRDHFVIVKDGDHEIVREIVRSEYEANSRAISYVAIVPARYKVTIQPFKKENQK